MTAAIDVSAVLEKGRPAPDEIDALRVAVATDLGTRKQLNAYLARLPGDASDATDAATAIRKGLALWATGREEEAATWLSRSDSKVSHLYRARCLASTGRPAEAISVLEAHADEPGAAATLAEAHVQLGDVEAARAQVGKLDAKADAAAIAYLNGRLADLEGDRQAARKAYEAALAADADHAPTLFRLAYSEHIYGDEDAALDYYKRCLDTPCPPINAYLNLGNLYEDRGEFSKARDCYTTVLKAVPWNQRAAMFRNDAAASLHMFYDEDFERRSDRRSQVLRLPVTDFELSVRSRNCLSKMGVRTLGDLIQRTEPELLSYKNFGETSLQEIKDILAQKGLRLGMGRDEIARDEQARSILETMGGGDADQRKMLEKPLSDLELSVRSRHCMNVLGLKTVGDLAQRSEAELMTIKNFGQTSMNEVKQKLAELGLELRAS